MIKTKFVFAVSMVAMLSCGVAWASVPSESETVAKTHEVYKVAENAGIADAPTDLATGIAGVTYVNRMVNTAGNAAQLAEDHAAAAGAYAIQAEKAAQDAEGALSGKLDNKFAANKNAIVTTDDDGTVTPVAISDDETKGAYITDVEVKDGVVTLSRGTPSISSDDVKNALDYTPEDEENKVIAYDADAEDGVKDVKYTSVTAAEEIASAFANAAVQQLGIANYATKTELNTTIEGLTNTVNAADNKVVVGVVQNNGKVTSVISSEVTKAMLASDIFGYIPINSNGTGSAQIWVE